MKVTYMGRSDHRIVSPADFPDWEFEEFDWAPGQTLEVPDEIGEVLVEVMRDEFKNRSDTTRDLRSKEELLEVAKEFKIKGRSNMDRDELLDAVVAEEIRLEEEALNVDPEAGNEPDQLDGSVAGEPQEA